MSWKINLAKMLSIGRNGESTNEMTGRPIVHSGTISSFWPRYSPLGVDDLFQWPKDMTGHIGDGVLGPAMSQFLEVLEEWLQRLKHPCSFDRLEVEAWAKDPQRGSLFVFTVEDSLFEQALEVCNVRLRDVAGDFLDVLLPQGLSKIGNDVGRHRRKSVAFGPLVKAKLQGGVIFLLDYR